ncbi:MAG: hypothetical protein F6K19_38635 [Cyanothece sp. SIO1E1]|nr:hypothetical protein [Cyanothece sp. SIO1E1]
MDIALSETLPVALAALLSLIMVLTLLLIVGLSRKRLPQLIYSWAGRFDSTKVEEIYQEVIQPYQLWLIWTTLLAIIDLTLLQDV